MARYTRDSLFDEVFPGLLERLRALGGHDLEPTTCATPNGRFDGNAKLTTAEMAVRHDGIVCADGRKCVVQIVVRAKLIKWVWVPQMVSYHCGPNAAEMDEVHFRIDSSLVQPFHVHIRGHGTKPEKGGHIHPGKVEPRPTLDPYTFMDLVEQFIKTNVIPLKVIRP